VTPAALLAAVAGALVVPAAWHALAALEELRLPTVVRGLLAPLRRARREGRAASQVERRRLAALVAVTALVAGWLLFGAVLGVLLALVAPPAVVAALRARRRRYLADLARDAPLVARALADALAGGHSIRGALAAAGRGLGGAAGGELGVAARALDLGEPTERVLERVRRRARSAAWDTIAAAVLLNREAGGDLAGLLRGTAAALEDVARLEREARSATAQARLTALIVAALPVGAALLAELASPGYLGRLVTSPLTAWLAAGALVLQGGALVLIHRLARVRA